MISSNKNKQPLVPENAVVQKVADKNDLQGLQDKIEKIINLKV